MTVGAVNGNYQMQPGQMGQNAADDPVAKGIQDKIAKAQKELKELSANTEMSIEQKQKKRQELQQEINDLNMQLRQHQMEQKQKERQEKMQSVDELTGAAGSKREENQPGETDNIDRGTGFSAVGMEALISADGARKAAQMQGSVAARMEGRTGTLEAEIKLDSARGGNTERKEAEVASLQEKAQAAQSSQIGTLREANEKLEEASQKEVIKETEEESAEQSLAGTQKAKIEDSGNESVQDEGTDAANVQGEADRNKTSKQAQQNGESEQERSDEGYRPVDIRI